MARQFPQFLFSNPKNTKSKGPFIIHTLLPISIIKINGSKDKWELILLEWIDLPMQSPNNPLYRTYKDLVIGEASEWLKHQISLGEIVF